MNRISSLMSTSLFTQRHSTRYHRLTPARCPPAARPRACSWTCRDLIFSSIVTIRADRNCDSFMGASFCALAAVSIDLTRSACGRWLLLCVLSFVSVNFRLGISSLRIVNNLLVFCSGQVTAECSAVRPNGAFSFCVHLAASASFPSVRPQTGKQARVCALARPEALPGNGCDFTHASEARYTHAAHRSRARQRAADRAKSRVLCGPAKIGGLGESNNSAISGQAHSVHLSCT